MVVLCNWANVTMSKLHRVTSIVLTANLASDSTYKLHTYTLQNSEFMTNLSCPEAEHIVDFGPLPGLWPTARTL